MRAIFAVAMLCIAASPALAEIASCYGAESGRQTASGERFDWTCPNGRCTAAMRSSPERPVPFGTLILVTYRARSVVVRVNDRGPFHRDRKTKRYDRDIDLSDGACARIGLLGPGVDAVQLEILPR
jgi:rare lipoprotein A